MYNILLNEWRWVSLILASKGKAVNDKNRKTDGAIDIYTLKSGNEFEVHSKYKKPWKA